MAVTADFTTTGRLRTTTVASVRFERPRRISFRLLRGPVPNLMETYELRGAPTGTAFSYSGELGTDRFHGRRARTARRSPVMRRRR